jgi:hypothetical protein
MALYIHTLYSKVDYTDNLEKNILEYYISFLINVMVIQKL